MSDGSEFHFHRSDTATGKERRPTVVSRNPAAQAAAVTMKNTVGGDRVGRRRELAGSDRVALDRMLYKDNLETYVIHITEIVVYIVCLYAFAAVLIKESQCYYYLANFREVVSRKLLSPVMYVTQ